MDYGSILRHFSKAIPSSANVVLSFDPLEIWVADIKTTRIEVENVCATGILSLAQKLVKIHHYPKKVVDSEYLREKRELEEFRKEQKINTLLNKHVTDVIKNSNSSLPVYQKHNDKLDVINEYPLQQYIHPTKKT